MAVQSKIQATSIWTQKEYLENVEFEMSLEERAWGLKERYST